MVERQARIFLWKEVVGIEGEGTDGAESYDMDENE